MSHAYWSSFLAHKLLPFSFLRSSRLLTASEYGRGRPERHPLPFHFSCYGNETKLDDCIIGSLTSCSSGIVAIECSNGMYFNNKMKNRKYHTVATVPKFFRKYRRKRQNRYPEHTEIHN